MPYFQVAYTHPGGSARTITSGLSLEKTWRTFQRDNPQVTIQSVASECGQVLETCPGRKWTCPGCGHVFSEFNCHSHRNPTAGVYYHESALVVECPQCTSEFIPLE